MRKLSLLLVTSALTLFNSAAIGATNSSIVELQTNLGTITVQLDHANAPITTKNFIDYVISKDKVSKDLFYRNTLIHRVQKGFVIQGGGVASADGQFKTPLFAPIKNESNNGLHNVRGSIAMARLSTSNDPSDPKGANTATSQFFINLVDNKFLDYDKNKADLPGYAVFGKVVKGMEVVDRIGKLATFSNTQLPYTSTNELVVVDNVYRSASINDKKSTTRITKHGRGVVTSSPNGINCKSLCVLSQPTGAPLTLSATPFKGYQFSGWRGDCAGFSSTLKIDTKKGNHNCTAVFSKIAPTS